ncbi:hypothetical protein GGS26DRAFT_594784 [Hypomontagnella submonticulosa]|nr:hypothetical protein GGS26DRAFT_594784 [Hypomontagnella submonticulosa]
MASSEQKDQNKAGKSFDTGSTNALPTADLASGIFEAPTQVSQPVSVSGGPLDKQAAGERSTTSEKTKSPEGAQEVVNSDGSISSKPKDTAGAGAMIL